MQRLQVFSCENQKESEGTFVSKETWAWRSGAKRTCVYVPRPVTQLPKVSRALWSASFIVVSGPRRRRVSVGPTNKRHVLSAETAGESRGETCRTDRRLHTPAPRQPPPATLQGRGSEMTTTGRAPTCPSATGVTWKRPGRPLSSLGKQRCREQLGGLSSDDRKPAAQAAKGCK